MFSFGTKNLRLIISIRNRYSTLLVLSFVTCALLCPSWSWAHDDKEGGKGDPHNRPPAGSGGGSTVAMGPTACDPNTGMAGPYPCHNIDLLSFLPLGDIGAGAGELGNDLWGWTDPLSGKDYAIMGLTDGTSFIDVSNPTSPVYLGKLPTHTVSSTWRDVKVYQDHAFVVADAAGSHGMQVFDLIRLRSVSGPPVTFGEDAHYSGFTVAHNVAINEDTGFAYATGTNTFNGGLHVVDVSDPTNPTAAGGYSAASADHRYTHDAQVVTYTGPDPDYQGREIAFNSNELVLNISDVTNKAAPVQIAHQGYHRAAYTHQGWLSEDQRYFFSNDELDERNISEVTRTRTHIWDVSDLDNPVRLGFFAGRTGSIDHNLYTYDGLAYEANYRSGLRVLDLKDVRNADLIELGSFDVYPDNNDAAFSGAWSTYRFAGSGTTIVSSIEGGLFVLDTSALMSGTPTPGVVNGSFENVKRSVFSYDVADGGTAQFWGDAFDPALPSNVYDITIPGWTGPVAKAGVRDLTDADFLGATDGSSAGPGIPDGENVLFLRSDPEVITVKSVLADVLEEDTLYTLSFDVGQSMAHARSAGYDVSLWAGGEMLGQITDLTGPAVPVGSFVRAGFDVDSTQFSHLLNEALEIQISTNYFTDNTGFTMFDLVTLDLTSLGSGPPPAAVPEPSSLAILFSLGVAGWLRKRRSSRQGKRCFSR